MKPITCQHCGASFGLYEYKRGTFTRVPCPTCGKITEAK